MKEKAGGSSLKVEGNSREAEAKKQKAKQLMLNDEL
jgi:hypothetical protein